MPRDLAKSERDRRAEQLLARGLTYAIALRDHDPAEIRNELNELPHADLVDMVIMLAAAAPVDPQARILRWWDEQGIQLADLTSACTHCERGFVRPRSEPGRLYCSSACRDQAFRDRRNIQNRAN